VWLWRWRRSPLRRRSDVVEAWVVLVAWTIAVVGGLLAGWVTASVTQQGLDRARAERSAVSAVLAEDAPGGASARIAGDNRVWATVRWKAPDGSLHADRAAVPPSSRAGNRITVWTDKHGALVSKPLSRGQAELQVAMSGALATVGAGGLVLAGAWIVRVRMDRRRLDQWAAEWKHLGTRGGSTTG
jgi:hypothetical protein